MAARLTIIPVFNMKTSLLLRAKRKNSKSFFMIENPRQYNQTCLWTGFFFCTLYFSWLKVKQSVFSIWINNKIMLSFVKYFLLSLQY